MADAQAAIRKDVIELLGGGGAHAAFDRAVADLPAELRDARPEGQPHTVWRLAEHMRLAQHDIVEFILDADHQSPPWPEGYWPGGEPGGRGPDDQAWERCLKGFGEDAERLEQLVADPQTNLIEPIPHGSGQTVLREAMLAADHNAYHLGQLVVVRRLLGAWEQS